MIVWGIDPGTATSGVVAWLPETGGVVGHMLCNYKVEPRLLRAFDKTVHVAIERITAQGRQRIGNETMQAIEWQARFERAAQQAGLIVRMIPRHEVRAHFGGPRTNDARIRELLILRWGGPNRAIGTKAAPGPLYGVKSHCWQALAVAVTYYDKLELEKRLED